MHCTEMSSAVPEQAAKAIIPSATELADGVTRLTILLCQDHESGLPLKNHYLAEYF